MRRADGTLGTIPRIGMGALVAGGAVLAAVLDPLALALYLSYVIVGLFLVVRRPANVVSWLLVGIAFGFIALVAAPSVDVPAIERGTGDLRDSLVVWVIGWAGAATFAGFLALTIVFPSGHFPDGRWRRPAIALLALGLVVVVLTAFAPQVAFQIADSAGSRSVAIRNPAAVVPDLPLWDWLPLEGGGVLPIVGLFAIGVVSMLVRYHRATGILRLQLRWLVAAVVFVVIGIVIGLISTEVFGSAFGGAAWIPAGVGYISVPLAIGVAVLRYRLYAIDRIVNRALVYGAVTAILAGVFAAATALSQRVFIIVTGETSDAGVVLTTLAVATLYAPVRMRVETVVDRSFKYEQRRFGRYRDDLTRFLDLIEPTRAAGHLAAEAMAETGAPGVAVIDAHGAVIASQGVWPSEPFDSVPIASRRFAEVRLGRRADGRPHDPERLAALAEVGALAAAAVSETKPSP